MKIFDVVVRSEGSGDEMVVKLSQEGFGQDDQTIVLSPDQCELVAEGLLQEAKAALSSREKDAMPF